MSDKRVMSVEAVRAVVEETVGDRPEVGVFLSPYGGGDPRDAVLELTRMSYGACDGCGQNLTVVQPGPVAWIDQRTGDVQGGYSHQHGCGEWNAPQAVRTTLVLLQPDEVDEHLAAREVAQERLRAQVAAMLAELDRQVAEDVAERETRLRADLREQLCLAVAELATNTAAEHDEEQRAQVDVAARRHAERHAALLNDRLDERIEQARRYADVVDNRKRAGGTLPMAVEVESERDALIASLQGQRTSWEAHYQPAERKSDQELLEEVCTGSEVEPGVYVDVDGRLAAWAPNVLRELDRDSEGIRVTQDDLAVDVRAQSR